MGGQGNIQAKFVDAMLISIRQRLSLILFLLSTALSNNLVMASSIQTPWPSGKAMPAFALIDIDGKTWRSSDLIGKVTVLNFWASWCEPCREEMPALARLANTQFEGQVNSLQVLTVNYQESETRVRRFMESFTPSLPALLDRDGQVTLAWTRRIFPTTVVIDPRGQARFTITGEYNWSGPAAEQLLRPLLITPVLSPKPMRK